MDAKSLIYKIENDTISYHADIHFLKNKLKDLLEKEEYESASVIHRWLEELLETHHKIKI
jgi:protein-arginine kinase activator protein McsA